MMLKSRLEKTQPAGLLRTNSGEGDTQVTADLWCLVDIFNSFNLESLTHQALDEHAVVEECEAQGNEEPAHASAAQNEQDREHLPVLADHRNEWSEEEHCPAETNRCDAHLMVGTRFTGHVQFSVGHDITPQKV